MSYKNKWDVKDLSELFVGDSVPPDEISPFGEIDPESEPLEEVKHVEVPASLRAQKDNIFKIMVTHFDPIKETVIQEKTGHATVELRKLLRVLKNDGLVKQIKPGVWGVTEATT